MNQKGFINIILGLGILIILSVFGYFFVNQKIVPVSASPLISHILSFFTPAAPIPAPTPIISKPITIPNSDLIRTEQLENYFTISQGEQIKVDALLIEAQKIDSLTDQGCLGGLVGCLDNVVLKISSADKTEGIILNVRGGLIKTKESEKIIYGYLIKLAKISNKKATIGVFKNYLPENPLPPDNIIYGNSGIRVSIFCVDKIYENPCGMVGGIIVKSQDFNFNQSGIEIARKESDSDGVFEISLKPGDYIVVPIDGTSVYPMINTDPQNIRVLEGKFTDIKISYWDGKK